MSKQLSFDFDFKNFYLMEDFIIHNSNEHILELISKDNKKFTSNLVIKGEIYSGKTHLCHYIEKKYNAIFIEFNEIHEINLLNYIESNKTYICDNVDLIDDEVFLFHLINIINTKNSNIIFTTTEYKNFNLKDLNSRFINFLHFEIKPPSPEIVKIILSSALQQRQIKISSNMLDFMTKFCKTYESIKYCIKVIRNNEKLNKEEIKNLLKIY